MWNVGNQITIYSFFPWSLSTHFDRQVAFSIHTTDTTSSIETMQPSSQLLKMLVEGLTTSYSLCYFFSRWELPYWARSKRAWERSSHPKRERPGLQCMEWWQTQWKKEQKKSKMFYEWLDFKETIAMDSLFYSWSILQKFKQNLMKLKIA